MMSALVFQVFELLFGYTQSISHVGAMCDNCGKVWPPLTSPQGSAAIELSYGCYLVKNKKKKKKEKKTKEEKKDNTRKRKKNTQNNKKQR
jgi:predicted lipoprotein with Yx(FWY)xxD motif